MESLANYITNYIVKDTQHDYEVIKYGVDAILSTGLCFSIALIVTWILGELLFGILFILILTPIKMQFRGYHCSSMGKCIITYSISVGVNACIYQYLVSNYIQINLLSFGVILFVLYLLVKKELNQKKKTYLCIYTLLGIGMYFISWEIFLILVLALCFEIYMLLLVFLKR